MDVILIIHLLAFTIRDYCSMDPYDGRSDKVNMAPLIIIVMIFALLGFWYWLLVIACWISTDYKKDPENR